MPVPAEYVRSLHAYELRILLALERLMRRYQWVPLEVLRPATGFSESELAYRLGRLMAMGMVRYEKTPYELPISLEIGDEVLIEGTGAYTTTYSAVAFNGFSPLKSYVI